MTYEEKVKLILDGIREAKKATRKGHDVKLYIKADNGLDKIGKEEVEDVLLKLEEENIFRLNTLFNRLLASDRQPKNLNYLLLEMRPKFDNWYEDYLLQQKSSLQNLNNINILRLYDVVLDINNRFQLTQETTIHIDLIPAIIRFQALFPADTIGLRDEYCENRLASLKYLKKKEIITDFSHGQNGWDTVVTVTFVLSKFDDFYKKIQDEYVKRNKSTDKNEEKLKNENLKLDSTKVKAKVNYNAQKSELDIEGKKVQFKKDSFRAKLLGTLLKDEKSRKKEWSWDEIYEQIENIEPQGDTEKRKVYEAGKGIVEQIASKIGIQKFLIYSTNTTRINPTYL